MRDNKEPLVGGNAIAKPWRTRFLSMLTACCFTLVASHSFAARAQIAAQLSKQRDELDRLRRAVKAANSSPDEKVKSLGGVATARRVARIGIPSDLRRNVKGQ